MAWVRPSASFAQTFSLSVPAVPPVFRVTVSRHVVLSTLLIVRIDVERPGWVTYSFGLPVSGSAVIAVIVSFVPRFGVVVEVVDREGVQLDRVDCAQLNVPSVALTYDV